jgi:ketosteroid isomerase-like protein
MRRTGSDHFDNLRLEPEELIDAGDRVVAVQRLSGRAKGSGIETELRFAVVYTISGGKIVRGREYMTREQALEAIGLDE